MHTHRSIKSLLELSRSQRLNFESAWEKKKTTYFIQDM